MNKRRGNNIGGVFTAYLVEMQASPAYRALSLSARRLLNRIEIELAHHGRRDNGDLPVTYDDFVSYGIDRHAIAPAIRECIALGFLRIKPGRGGNAEFRAPNLFRLTYIHTRTKGEMPTHEWRGIATIERAMALALTARRGGRRKQKPVGIYTTPSGGNPHRSPVAETPTTGPVGETHTTLDISGWGSAGGETSSEDWPEPKGAVIDLLPHWSEIKAATRGRRC